MRKPIQYSTEVFISPFKKFFERFVEEKRASSYDYKSSAKTLQNLDRFLNENYSGELRITKDIVDKWCARRQTNRGIESLKSNACRRAALRVFSSFLMSENIPVDAFPEALKHVNAQRYAYHIYSNEELQKIVHHASKLKATSNSPFRHIVMPKVIMTLALTGLRISEALNLKVNDFLYSSCKLRILDAKNGTNRMVPVSPEFADTLADFIADFHAASEGDDYLFPIRPGEKFITATFHHSFVQILKNAGIPWSQYHGPRVHDLRHTYCVNILRYWRSQGIPVNAMLPALVNVLGHSSVTETSLYVHNMIEDMERSEAVLSDAYPDLYKGIYFDEQHNNNDHNNHDDNDVSDKEKKVKEELVFI